MYNPRPFCTYYLSIKSDFAKRGYHGAGGSGAEREMNPVIMSKIELLEIRDTERNKRRSNYGEKFIHPDITLHFQVPTLRGTKRLNDENETN